MGLTGMFSIYKMFILLYVLFIVDAVRRDYILPDNRQCAQGTGDKYSVYDNVTNRHLYSICYNIERGITIFTHHYIDHTVEATSEERSKSSFSIRGLPVALLVQRESRDPYMVGSQMLKFEQLLGPNIFINNESRLERGHLVPNADFPCPENKGTYYLLNAVPQWRAINGVNWRILEIQIRAQVQYQRTIFSVYTGTFDTLKLPDQYNNEVYIYLAGNNLLPVPKYIWKVVQRIDTNEAIAFVVHNNPFDPNPVMPCTDVCGNYNWTHANWRDYKHGYLVCCTIQEFTQNINNLDNQISPNSHALFKETIVKNESLG